MATNKSKHRRP